MLSPPTPAWDQQGWLKEAKGSQHSPATAPIPFGDELEISALPATETVAPAVPSLPGGAQASPLGEHSWAHSSQLSFHELLSSLTLRRQLLV